MMICISDMSTIMRKRKHRTSLSNIYHSKFNTYLNDKRILHELTIENNDVICTFNGPLEHR